MGGPGGLTCHVGVPVALCLSSQCTFCSCVRLLQRVVVLGGDVSVVSAPMTTGRAGTTVGRDGNGWAEGCPCAQGGP